MVRRLLLAAALASALVCPARRAHADDGARERSRAAFRRGVAQAEAKNYAAARDSFLEAYRIFAHPSILLDLAIARTHTGEWLQAEQDLVRFLADDGGAQPDELASARAALAQTRSHLGTFRLSVSPDGARATLDSRPLALIPGQYVDVRATRGLHDLHVEADGYAPVDRSLVVEGEQAPDVTLALAPVAEPATAGRSDGRRIAGWFLLGGGGVAAGVGLFAGLQAKSLADAYDTVGSGHFQDQATKASGLVFRTSADVAFLGALALGGTGLYLLFTTPSSPSTQARVVLGPVSGIAGAF